MSRNRTTVAQQFLSQSWQKKPLLYSLPTQQISSAPEKLAELGKRLDEANNRSKALQRDLDAILADSVREIALGRDPVSIQLAPILTKAMEPKSDELARARHRKEVGNPPGKRTDPLGDQITWEQFLSRVKGEPLLWVVTGDSDYRYELPDKSFVLNPVLQADVTQATGAGTEVRCFATLADGLKDAADVLKRQPAKKLTPEEIAAIRATEIENAARRRTPAVVCPRCGGATSWRVLQAAHGYHGGVVFFTCPLCGAQFDTE